MIKRSIEDDGNFVFVENVPAYVCIRCGENTYSPETTDELLRIVKQRSAPSRKTVVPVYDFALNLGVMEKTRQSDAGSERQSPKNVRA